MGLPAALAPCPRILLDRDARSMNGRKFVSEMARQPQPELLDLTDRRFLGVCVDGVFLRVGRHDVGIVPFEVAARKVAGQGNADVDVLDLVHGTVRPAFGHADHMRLRLAVLVLAQPDGHRLTSLYMWSSRTGSGAAARAGALRDSGG